MRQTLSKTRPVSSLINPDMIPGLSILSNRDWIVDLLYSKQVLRTLSMTLPRFGLGAMLNCINVILHKNVKDNVMQNDPIFK
jgi:hypothetical protein